MHKEIEARIYLAEKRGHTQTDFFRSFHTFCFGDYFDESRVGFGTMLVCNDDTLEAGYSLQCPFETDLSIAILPLNASLHIKADAVEFFLQPQQLYRFDVNTSLQVLNKNESTAVQFLQFWFTSSHIARFQNYAGREKGDYKLLAPNSNAFVFVVDGVFEVEDRLLQARDGLSLSNIETIAFEALSDNASLLIFEV